MASIVNPRSLAQLICASCQGHLEIPVHELYDHPVVGCPHCGERVDARRLALLLKGAEREFRDLPARERRVSAVGSAAQGLRPGGDAPGYPSSGEANCPYVRRGWIGGKPGSERA